MRALWTAVVLLALGVGDAGAGVLDRARESGELRIAYRADAQPFSYVGTDGKAAGYSIDLCRAVGRAVATQIGNPNLKLVEVEVTATNRLDAVADGRADLLCEATSVTLSRREKLDFSMPTFATGATLLYPENGAKTFEDLAGKKVGVLAGSTTEAGLRTALERANISAEIVTVPSHTDAIQKLASGEFAAYFGDGAILLYNLMHSPFRRSVEDLGPGAQLRALCAGAPARRRRLPARGRPRPGRAVAQRRGQQAVRQRLRRRCGTEQSRPRDLGAQRHSRLGGTPSARR